MISRTLLFLTVFAAPAFAQHQPPQGVDPSQFKPLAERKDVVSWKTLAQVELVKMKDRYVPQFASGVAALDQKQVKVQGFMLPLQMGDKQQHFVLLHARRSGKHGRGEDQDAGEVHLRRGGPHRQACCAEGRPDRHLLPADRGRAFQIS
jgi:hypothetical protein